MALSDAEQKELLELNRKNNLYLQQLQAEVVATIDANGKSRMDRMAKTLDSVWNKVRG